ncbi:hypothetical protein [Chroococcidiopsis sp.]|uniref:hypothetical protein n=1 Tax=Chroococcidiopsis sp. TaxID=3088168 RepID=UPI003F329CC6
MGERLGGRIGSRESGVGSWGREQGSRGSRGVGEQREKLPITNPKWLHSPLFTLHPSI